MSVIELLKPFMTGLIVGVIFTLLKLPIPAPWVLSWIIGIVGIYIGFVLVGLFMK